jgi:hypothetical protein
MFSPVRRATSSPFIFRWSFLCSHVLAAFIFFLCAWESTIGCFKTAEIAESPLATTITTITYGQNQKILSFLFLG